MGAAHGKIVAARILLAAGADITLRVCGPANSRKTPLGIAARSGQVETMREFARHGVGLDASCEETGCTALIHAARKNYAGAVDSLIEAGASITAAALDCVTNSLALETMITLLRHGAPIRAAVVGGLSNSEPASPHRRSTGWYGRRGGSSGPPLEMG